MSKSTLILGGGFAGLSAATALAERGIPATVIEGRQILGGRAFSFKDADTGDSIDNGQHLFMACYHETVRFLHRIQTLHRLAFQRSLSVPFAGPRGRRAKLSCLPLKAPWHLYSGIARLSTALSLGDRWRMRHVETALRNAGPNSHLDDITVDAWLTQLHQSDRAKRHFWDLITIATLNEDPKVAAAGPFVTVLKQAFFEDWTASRLALAKVGLSDLYVPESVAMIEKAGGRILTKSPVERLELNENRVTGVVLRDGRRLAADSVISTVPPHAFLKLLPPERIAQDPYFSPHPRAALRADYFHPFVVRPPDHRLPIRRTVGHHHPMVVQPLEDRNPSPQPSPLGGEGGRRPGEEHISAGDQRRARLRRVAGKKDFDAGTGRTAPVVPRGGPGGPPALARDQRTCRDAIARRRRRTPASAARVANRQFVRRRRLDQDGAARDHRKRLCERACLRGPGVFVVRPRK